MSLRLSRMFKHRPSDRQFGRSIMVTSRSVDCSVSSLDTSHLQDVVDCRPEIALDFLEGGER